MVVLSNSSIPLCKHLVTIEWPLEILLKNIENSIPIIIQKEGVFSFESFIRGYHAYMHIWTPKVGDENLSLQREDGNEHDQFSLTL